MPALASEDWATFTQLMTELGSAREWIGQIARVRAWYRPHLERLYDAAHVRLGDIEQLERLAGQFGSRERFITEMTLDPPQAAGDLAGTPLQDEDYLILSTVHSAKGQEWDAVYVLNMADGNFPNEHATGKPELIEEERRLLYVAMTRAKHELHLIAPLKYYVTQQSRMGDAHVYGARSRFVTEALLAKFEQRGWPETAAPSAVPKAHNARIDVAAKLRDLWR
jgi:DNA helicase-2/ATP-dependent DNA helicase PcrA